MGKVAYITRCILMDNLHIPSSGSTTVGVELVSNRCSARVKVHVGAHPRIKVREYEIRRDSEFPASNKTADNCRVQRDRNSDHLGAVLVVACRCN
jgi:hypothetical protein